jgi:hypothetical protein
MKAEKEEEISFEKQHWTGMCLSGTTLAQPTQSLGFDP